MLNTEMPNGQVRTFPLFPNATLTHTKTINRNRHSSTLASVLQTDMALTADSCCLLGEARRGKARSSTESG